MEPLRKGMKIAGIAASGARDIQGETLSIDGADITELQLGKGRLNDNHSSGFGNTLGKVTYAKKIYKAEDCSNDRQKYYFNKLKSPIIYFEGELFDSEDHPNAKATAAILRHINKSGNPLKIGASVEGGVLSRNTRDPSHLERTMIHSIALTFTPANRSTLVEPISVSKSASEDVDMELIRSVVHLAKTDVPSFRYVEKNSQASKVIRNLNAIAAMLGNERLRVAASDLVQKATESKIANNIISIKNLVAKALTAGYGSGSPSSLVGGAVIQPQALESLGKKEVRIVCDSCGHDQAYVDFQTRCRDEKCGKPFSMAKLLGAMKSLKH